MTAAGGGIHLFEGQSVGVVDPKQTVTVAEVRRALENNALQAERRFAEPFIVSGTLQLAPWQADRAIVVGFKERARPIACGEHFLEPRFRTWET
ncbi:hypothetical protein [Belnapia sp. F-4-1]|uniref:hypothetical protein n=1 Tax=Belnapia sp. F-4-1 TaxID=1545443 RepID=UPI00118561F0|nr:hypothetical protein [Belnapia sp. F-4-1]